MVKKMLRILCLLLISRMKCKTSGKEKFQMPAHERIRRDIPFFVSMGFIMNISESNGTLQCCTCEDLLKDISFREAKMHR